ncbi:MAG: hypothetical protein JNL30_05765 [Rubrivivax sp.]|nr:hypothetical protein [Rubrivivax sp.]
MRTLETDYLVIGAGASGLAFVDTLLDESPAAHITLVERRGLPGGHWNDSYPFVTLHQPSAFYGVNSMELGTGRKDTQGLNAGLAELASGPEICGYYQRLVRQRLAGHPRIDYRPLTRWHADEGVIENTFTGERCRVTVRRKVVDAAYMSPSVPATHRRRFDVAEGAQVVPPNALAQPGSGGTPPACCVIGAGKTAMDTLTWLLQVGVPPAALHWVVPRDSWLVNRLTTQTGEEFFHDSIGGQARQMQAAAEATSVDDLFLRLEACGQLLRIHRDRVPTMFHLATLTPAEARWLAQVEQVIRLGHVRAVQPGGLVLDQGRVALPAGTLFIDCTASAVEPRAVQPIFQPGRLLLQLVRLPQPTFSAALVAYVEAHHGAAGDKACNALAGTVPFPYRLADYPRALLANLWNQLQWSQHPPLRQWIRASRLDGFGRLMSGISEQDTARRDVVARLKALGPAAMTNLQRLAAQG